MVRDAYPTLGKVYYDTRGLNINKFGFTNWMEFFCRNFDRAWIGICSNGVTCLSGAAGIKHPTALVWGPFEMKQERKEPRGFFLSRFKKPPLQKLTGEELHILTVNPLA
jgi:hypothetical protein